MSIVVRKVNVPWAIDRKNYYTFSSVNERTNYMIAHGISYVIDDTDRSFTFRDGYIDLDLTSEIWSSLRVGMHWQYIMITTEYEDFFYFVTHFEYINLHTTRLYLEPDYVTTYLPYITPVSSYVERCHVNVYTKNGNLYELTNDAYHYLSEPEPYEVGEFIRTGIQEYSFGVPIAVVVTDATFLSENNNSTSIYNETTKNEILYPRMWFIPIKGYKFSDGMQGWSVNQFVSDCMEQGKANHILSIQIYPAGIPGIDIDSNNTLTFSSNFTIYAESIGQSFKYPAVYYIKGIPNGYKFITGSQFVFLNGRSSRTLYDPKCYCKPYSYLQLTEANNIVTVYDNLYLKAQGSLPPTNLLYSVYPGVEGGDVAYLSLQNGETDTITKINNNFPSYPYQSDKYATYIYENRSRIISNIINSAVSVSFSSNLKEAAGRSGELLTGGFSTLAKLDDLKRAPTTASPSVDNVYYNILGLDYLTLSFFTQKESQMKHLTDMFNRYGYTINDVIVPDLNSRPAWNYIKSPEFNFTSSSGIPQDAVKAIKDIFASGVTLWHYNGTTDTMYDTTLDNREVFA